MMGPNMKRIRSEQLQSIATQYLKRRRYSDGEISQRKERRTQSVEEMALTRSMLGEGSSANVIAYSSISGDATAYDQQYTRLKSFVSGDSVLEKLLFPLCIHMYLELLANGQKTPAHKFLSRHSKAFRQHNSQQQQMLQELTQLQNKQEMATNPYVTEFRSNKYSLSLSEEAIGQLQNFLKNEDNVLLLQMFNSHIDISVTSQSGRQDIVQKEDRSLEDSEPVSQPCTPENKVIQNELTLSSLQHCIRRLRDGPPCLTSVAFYTALNAFQGLCSAHISPDERLLCCGLEDSTVRVWSLKSDKLRVAPCPNNSGIDFSAATLPLSHVADHEDEREEGVESMLTESETMTLRAHSGAVYGTTFMDQRFLLSASEDTTVRLWDLESCSNRVVYRGHTYPVWGIDASPLGQQFASCSHDRTGKIWSTDRIYPLRSLIGHLSDVDVIKFHPNGSYLATGSSDRTVRLWSSQEGRTMRLLQGHRATVMALAFSPNGQLLASAGEDRRIRIWELTTGLLLKEFRGHTDTVYTLAFNRDSSTLASGGMDSTIRVWDVRRDKTQSSAASAGGGGSESHGAASPELMAVFPTKSTTVHYLRYASKNFLLAAGSIQP